VTKICQVQVNGETFAAHQGDLLLDAALMNGIELPHDCRSGYCGTCRVRVLAGHYFGGASSDPGFVHACQCRVVSDLRIAVDDVPAAIEIDGRVSDLVKIAPDVFELCIEPAERLDYIPGQYLSLRFRGFPARHYSPTAPLDPGANRDVLRFHVRQFPRGRVSAALAERIVKGHRVKLTGPYGAAYFRPRNASRHVLVSSGTGFAPIWAVADAAIREWPERELVLVGGARSLASLYMIPAACQLAQLPRTTITLVSSMRQDFTRAVRYGRPTDYLPVLRADDVVYVAGAPAMVEAVTAIAHAAGSVCFADPFAPADARGEGPTFLSRAAGWFARGAVTTH
jgi:3-phenylpropionate/trans-cinnamate dioxygenase ferredoxin reductase subunit